MVQRFFILEWKLNSMLLYPWTCSFAFLVFRFTCLSYASSLDWVILWSDSNNEFFFFFFLLFILIIEVIGSKTFSWIDCLSFCGFLDNLDLNILFFNSNIRSNFKSFITYLFRNTILFDLGLHYKDKLVFCLFFSFYKCLFVLYFRFGFTL